MSNEFIVVESGVIQCEHGAPVVLKSTVPNHVIGGKKPLYNKDILQAVVVGCPYRSSKNGQCKKVVAISSATTESNVSNAGGNYLLRVDGCKTDNGSALVLVDPGQTNSKVPVKSSGSAGSITAKELEDAKIDTKENIKNEKYRIHPLRRSNGDIRALRGARDFRLDKNFHYTDNYTHEKVLTKTDAYLYVKYNGKITEYKVINRGDLFNPIMHKVQFKDTKTNVIRRYIPFYEETGTLNFVYSNIKLTDAQFEKFTPTELTVEDKNNACVIHPKEYSKEIKAEIKAFRKKEQKAGVVRAESKTRKYVSALLYLDDPVGEVEDLYEEYEFAYHRTYSKNKPTIDDFKNKNKYAYTIAEILDYFYVNKKEQNDYDKQRDELREQYVVLADGVNKFGDYILAKGTSSNIVNTNLASFIDYKVAKDYMDEVKFIDDGFFESISPWFSRYDEEHFYLYANNISHLYAQKGYNSGALFQKRLKLQGKGYKREEKPSDALAFVIFTIYFSKKHSSELDKYPDLKEAANKFFYLLKKATPLPHINEKAKGEIHDKLDEQVGFKNAITGEKSLLSEYRDLDDKLKKIAFDPKGEKYSYKSLKTAQQTKPEIYYDKELKTPKELLKDISKALGSPELKTTLEKYISLKTDQKAEDKYAYYLNLINLAFMLMHPRAKVAEETEKLSPFHKSNKAIEELVYLISVDLLELDEEMALKLHAEDIKIHYLNALYSLIAEAKLSKGDRATNVNAFLKKFNEKVATQRGDVAKEDTSELLSQDFDKELKLKSESQSLHETLKNLNGVSSYLAKFEENEYDALADGSQRSKQAEPYNKLKNSKAYKQLLASTKVLSFFVAAGNIAEFMKGKESLKLNNLVNLSEDVLSVSSTLAEFASKADHHLEQRVGQRVRKFNIPSSIDELVKVNKVAPASSMRVIARFGLVPVMLNAVIELREIDIEKNRDYFIATATKHAIFFVMLFPPATVGIGTIVISMALLELAWALVKDSIENSKLELFINDSLLYQEPFTFIRRERGSKLYAHTLLSAVNSSGKSFLVGGVDTKGSEIRSFDTVSKVQEFIADNYDKHSSLFDTALIYEISQLRSILYGFTISPISQDHPLDLRYGPIEIHPKSHSSVKLSSSLKSNATDIYLSYKEVDKTRERVYEKLSVNAEYDITSPLLSNKRFSTYLESINFNAKSYREKLIWVGSPAQTQTMQEILEDVYMIVVTPETTIRYNIIYNLEYKLAQTDIYIKEIQAAQLSQEDMKEIEGNK